MTKPAGPLCNLDCHYCFYLEKSALFPESHVFRMSEAVLENYIRQYILAQPGPEIQFAWQGGEPTLAGLPFFRKVVALQKRHGFGKRIENAFQTNGTTLNEEWCRFLKDENFLVGISIDGPRTLHDAYRKDRAGRPTFRKVMRGIELCKKYGVNFNTLTVVHARNVDHPLEIYRFLRGIGSSFLQFIPLVERLADDSSRKLGLHLAHPPQPGITAEASPPPVTAWSVPADKFGRFLCAIFDRWVSRDVGRVYIQLFDGTLGKWLGLPGGSCVHAETCGRALALEHNGDLYACDHYVYPQYRLGNITESSMAALADGETMRGFGNQKRESLTRQCRSCEFLFACQGDCPKHRFAHALDGEPGLSYLCPAYYRFFRHSAPAMQRMADLYRSGQPPAAIMEDLSSGPRRKPERS